MTAAIISDLERIFELRRAIARLGEVDWMRWWNSNAMTDAGRYAMPRLFARTAEMSAAHVAIASARARHDAAVPREPVVHLFNLGESFEGAFERWIIGRKADGATAAALPRPSDEQRQSATAALLALGVSPADVARDGESTAVLGSMPIAALENAKDRVRMAEHLAAAYAASEPGRLVVPLFRLER